jgi:cytochrome P450
MDGVEGLIARFDHHSSEYAREGVPYKVFEGLREKCPVVRTDVYDGMWVLTRYDDIKRVTEDTETFSSTGGITVPDGTERLGPDEVLELRALVADAAGFSSIVTMDPPEHLKIRRALNPPFSPGAVLARESFIRDVTDRTIDSFIDTGHCDVFGEFCAPVPAIVVLEWLGLPTEEWKKWSDPVLYQFGGGMLDEARASENLLSPGQDDLPTQAQSLSRKTGADALDMGELMTVLAARRREPREDLFSYLAQTTVDGRPLEDGEIMGTMATLILAGLDTTTNAVATTVVELARRPQLRTELAASDDATLWTAAVEESLRFSCPVQGFKRTAVKDADVGGVRIKAGERVFVLWAAANRDPNVFSSPNEFDIHRQNNRHLSFGNGVHRCLGMHLARLEIKVMLQQLLRRIPDFTVGPELPLHRDCGLVFGYESVPFQFPVPAER